LVQIDTFYSFAPLELIRTTRRNTNGYKRKITLKPYEKTFIQKNTGHPYFLIRFIYICFYTCYSYCLSQKPFPCFKYCITPKP